MLPVAQRVGPEFALALVLERLAGLKHEARFGWHSLRHAFATALRSQPDVDVAALGGWKSPVTLKLCYQHPELDRMQQALRQLRAESTKGAQAAEPAMRGAPPNRVGLDGACTCAVMGLGRVERPTSRLSGVRSNHLSYRPARCYVTKPNTLPRPRTAATVTRHSET